MDGIAKGLQTTGKGTIQWKIEDDNGRKHKIDIPNSLLVPKAQKQIMLPQHWEQEKDDNHPEKQGTYCGTYDDGYKIFWQQRQFVKTVKHNNQSNVPVMSLVVGVRTYRCFDVEQQLLICTEQ